MLGLWEDNEEDVVFANAVVAAAGEAVLVV